MAKQGFRLSALAIAALCAFAAPLAQSAAAPSTVTVQPVQDLRADFMMGADVSMTDQLERLGAKFYDAQGQQKDIFAILKENGVNWIRLRLWNNPVNAADVVEGGKTLSRKGEPVGGGNNDLAATIRMATRAKALGLKVLLDFHYSDFWVDPDKQNKPAAWANLKGAELEKAVHDYTADVLKAMREAKASPDMVQIGNELNGGMLWPDGKTWKAKPEEQIGGDDGFVALLSQGIKAAREADPSRQMKIAVHLANGATNDLYRRVFDLLTKKGVDYDIIGLSFYPYWHGTLEDFQTNVDDISSRYAKEVVLMETAYAFTTEDGDGFPNLFNRDMQKSVGYRATVQGQTSLVRDLINAMAQVPGSRGAGLFYWEPGWIPVKGAGWRTGEGNAWDNQAMFDFKGRALPSLAVFKRVREAGSEADVPKLLPIAAQKLTTYIGEVFTPPEKIRVSFSDDAQRDAWVSWDDVPADKLKEAGNFVLKGHLSNHDVAVEANVAVVPRRNLIEDPSFENGKLEGWNIAGSTAAVSNERNPGNAKTGQQSMHYWLGEPFKFEATRSYTGIPNGTYSLKIWAAGGGGEKAIEVLARDCGDGKRYTKAITNTGWQKWAQYVVTGIKVTNGSCTVGVAVDGQTGNWGNFDDVEFIRDGAN
ncbi:glycosyl hydrolase 53 family protein [Niveibacterium umoris]|uniref:Arabinogalactan endo-beta-1,4-galactanase n=1 Tax=Niveibacterium umoris TaxID=1193620 RepID=A0A840BNR1_9RHOO|nr:glycosyl hydrolase 53 family protein [Niveibacterium umoris]MBB4013129.1 arabinogalactan endo-1,4-beta-galactosidase [Niveibacterium umoris]